MNLLDLTIVALGVLAAIGGYRAGLVARALSWAGLVVGLVIAARLVPDVVEGLGEGDPRSRFLVAAAVLLLGAFAGQALGLLLGARLHVVLPPGSRQVDRVGGAAAGVLGILVGLWLLLPGLAEVPGELSYQARTSRIARWVATTAPAPPDTLQALRQLVGESRFPRVFEAMRPAPDTGPPPAESGIPAALLDRAAASTVRVEGEACGRIQEGSGFVVLDDLVVTNAHVVAGQRSTSVTLRSGQRVAATVVHFDPDRDLALLDADLDLAPLPVGEGEIDTRGAVLGYPGGGPLEVSPFEVREEVDATGRDLYDNHRIERRVLVLAAELRAGDSGGALVDTTGTVVGVAFAIAPDRPGTGYTLDTSELEAALDVPHAGKVSTGECI